MRVELTRSTEWLHTMLRVDLTRMRVIVFFKRLQVCATILSL
jgi:predicted transglutaminase-like protease